MGFQYRIFKNFMFELFCNLIIFNIMLFRGFQKMVAGRTEARERVWVRSWKESVWMNVVCVWVTEGQLNWAGVAGHGQPGSPGQGEPTTIVDTPWVAGLMNGDDTILKGIVASFRNPSTPDSSWTHCLHSGSHSSQNHAASPADLLTLASSPPKVQASCRSKCNFSPPQWQTSGH